MELIKYIIETLFIYARRIFLLPNDLILGIYIFGKWWINFVANKKKEMQETDKEPIVNNEDMESLNETGNQFQEVLQKTKHIKYVFCTTFWFLIYYITNK